MIVNDESGWSDLAWNAWTDLRLIRSRLDAGADPNSEVLLHGRPLHAAAERGTPAVVEELARRVDDVDAEYEGRTALWTAVFANRPDNARALVAAGADPWRPMMNGWSPGRLSLVTPTPDLFALPDGETGLSAEEVATVAETRRLIAALGDSDFDSDGFSLACVAGLTAAEAAQRLKATPVDDEEIEEMLEEPLADGDDDDIMAVVGITDVPGGCVVSQPWGYVPSATGICKRLSVGTVSYGMYANPKSGDQGSVFRDGDVDAWDTHPGGGDVSDDDSAAEILIAYLCQEEAVAYCFAGAGLRPTDARSLSESPDMWVRLPQGDWWD